MSLTNTISSGVSSVKDSISSGLKSVNLNSMTDSISSTTVNATQSVQNYFSNYSNTTIIIGLIIIILLALFISYGLYWFVSFQLFNNTVNVIYETNTPLIGTSLSSLAADITPCANGKRRAYTFWIYLNDMSKYQGIYKHVLHLTKDDKDPITNASPYIFLDKNENKLYIRFTKKDNNFTATDTSIMNFNDTNISYFMSQGIVIPYIPLQRWVHVGIVINETTTTTMITCYVDGDIVANKSLRDKNDAYTLTENFEVATEGALGAAVAATPTSAAGALAGSASGTVINPDGSTASVAAACAVAVAVTSASVTSNPTGIDYSKVDYTDINTDTTGRLIIGGDNLNTGVGAGFSGLISKFKSYNYDINQKDIYKDYNEGPVNNLLVNLGIGNYGIRNPIYKVS